MDFTFSPIGFVRSCFPEKFGIPRQAGLAPEARARIELGPSLSDALEGLEQSTHLWIVFVFHESIDSDAKTRLTVRPPRLGGQKRLGVFATRSPHRPNAIGISACKIEKIHRDSSSPTIEISGVDLLDGTPVLDLKPYVPYADSIADARCEWAPSQPPEALQVEFDESTKDAMTRLNARHPGVAELARRLIALDPRPAHQSDSTNEVYSMRLLDVDLHWRAEGGNARVFRVDEL